MGAFVDKLTPFYVSIGTPWVPITETIDYTRGYADDMRTTLMDAINDLAALAGTYTPNVDAVADDVPTLSHPSLPPRPDVTVALNDDWPDTVISEPSELPIDEDLGFEMPLSPEDLDVSFDHKPNEYQSCFGDALCKTLTHDLLNGGTGIPDAIHAALIDHEREGRRLAEDRARRKLSNALGETGFDIASGAATAAVLELEEDILRLDTDASNSIAVKEYDIATEQSKEARDFALRLEELNQKRFVKQEELLFEVAKAVNDYIIAKYEQSVKLYLAKVDALKGKLAAAKSRIEAIVSINEGRMKLYEGRVDVLRARISAIAEENKSKTDSARAVADIYTAEVRGIMEEFRMLAEEVRVAADVYRTKVDAAISKEKINLDAFTSGQSLAERISESIANIAAQAVASALGAIHTGMSYNYQGSTSASAHSNISNSLTESHSYQEE